MNDKIVSDNESSDNPKKKKLRKLPSWLTDEEVNQFFNAISNVRDRMLFQVIYFFGLRVNEATHVTKADFNLKEKYLKIHAKNSKVKSDRLLPIPAKFHDTLKHYLSLCPDNERIFPLCNSHVWALAKQYAKRANLEKRVSPHVFRHSYLSKVMEMTDNIYLVKMLAGHQSLQTTEMYLHTNVKNMGEKVNKVFPE